MSTRSRRWILALMGAVALFSVSVRAEEVRYVLEFGDQEATTYTLEIPVVRPGVMKLDARWGGARTVSFRLEGPGHPTVKTRRAGPSPVSLEVPVTDRDVSLGGPWTLIIRAVPARGRTEGALTLALPDDPAIPQPVAETEPSAPAVEPEPWMVRREAPKGASRELARVFEALEKLRAWVVSDDGEARLDSCGWQVELLRYLGQQADGLVAGHRMAPEETRRYLQRLARGVARVDELSASDDPILAGPVPANDLRRRAWLAVRRQRIEPIEDELDGLVLSLRRGYAPELAHESWPQRFVGCLTACERHYEQRVRVGVDRAPNRELTLAQWDGFLVAAEALEALAGVHGPLPSLSREDLARHAGADAASE